MPACFFGRKADHPGKTLVVLWRSNRDFSRVIAGPQHRSSTVNQIHGGFAPTIKFGAPIARVCPFRRNTPWCDKWPALSHDDISIITWLHLGKKQKQRHESHFSCSPGTCYIKWNSGQAFIARWKLFAPVWWTFTYKFWEEKVNNGT